MIFDQPLIPARSIKRYKRFMCDVILDKSGEQVVAHCPNSGSMKGIPLENSPVMVSYHPSPTRKLKYTLEMVFNGSIWVGVNTGIPNHLVADTIAQNKIPELAGYSEIRKEVKYSKNSRIDILLSDKNKLCYVEVKNVTLIDDTHAIFPDAVTTRGQKHLNDLMEMKNQGHRAVMFFTVQRTDCDRFRPAYEIDPDYAKLFTKALDHGVEAYAYQTKVTPQQIEITHLLPIDWPPEN